MGLIPGGSLIAGGIDALTGSAFSGSASTGGKPIELLTPEEAAAVLPEIEKKYNTANVFAKKVMDKTQILPKLRAKAAQQPIIAAEPTNIPMVGKTSAGLAPIMPQLEPAKPGFGGLSTTNLILLGLGGFLAFKLLNK
jgi:hypothetical protein